MNPNVWNIKEILSIPTGNSGTRNNNNNNASTSSYSSVSLTDSQFVFGSQFWPDSSSGMSQEFSLSSRNSQRSSQGGSEQKISCNYHTKPFLFGTEGKDKGMKPVSILDKFDEDKTKAKEKNESDMLAKESFHFRETLNNLQQSVFGTEKNITTILEGFDHFAVTLQQNQCSLRDGITQQFETMLNEVISQKQMLTSIKGKLLETGVATTELGSYMHGLEKSLEALRQEHRRGTKQLEKAMQLLSTLVSNHSTRNSRGGAVEVVENGIQTSPGLVQPDSQPEGQELPCGQLECTQQSNVSSWHPRGSAIAENSKPLIARPSQRSHRRMKKRPLLIPKRRKSTTWDQNSQPLNSPPLIKGIKKDISSPLKEICNEAATAGRKGVSVIHHKGGIDPTIEPKRETPEKARGLWQVFDIYCDSE